MFITLLFTNSLFSFSFSFEFFNGNSCLHFCSLWSLFFKASRVILFLQLLFHSTIKGIILYYSILFILLFSYICVNFVLDFVNQLINLTFTWQICSPVQITPKFEQTHLNALRLVFNFLLFLASMVLNKNSLILCKLGLFLVKDSINNPYLAF